MAQQIVFTDGSDLAFDRSVQREAEEGKLLKVHAGIYVEKGILSVERILSTQWAAVLAKIAPKAVLGGRSALRGTVWRDSNNVGWIFATHSDSLSAKRLSLPGLEIRSVPGVGPIDGDLPFLGVYLPSPARKFLENLMPSRARGGPSRTAGREMVEIEIERYLRTNKEEGLVEMRRHAAVIAPKITAQRELEELNDIIGTVLGTRKTQLSSNEVSARTRRDYPYDPHYLDKLKLLATTMAQVAMPNRPDPHISLEIKANTSFIEAYFTNYIEGTKFLVEKAKRIVFEQAEPDGRPADGRDVTQSFHQIAHLGNDRPASNEVFGEFLDEIRERNSLLLDARPEMEPGLFKTDPNRAGNTVFVMPNLVVGTLREGWSMMQGIEQPFARALFAHTLLVLVHPFNDGNGRLSRIMMTKELLKAGQCRAIVPTIFRTDYINGLRALTADEGPRAAPLIKAMLGCQEATAKIAEQSLDRTIEVWASSHAFLENEKDAKFTPPNQSATIEWRDGIPAPAEYWETIDLNKKLAEAEASSNFKL
jgi:hypothetical protein